VRKGQLLLAKRKGKHAAGLWSCPGGWVDFGEEPMVTALRELLEETGLTIEMWNPKARVEFIGYYNNVFREEQIQSLTLHFLVEGIGGKEPKILEPEKCSEIRWFPLDALPPENEMFPGLLSIIKKLPPL
jgi:ADP-ribose pyrophosphatase YjhB (NUDIX family)